jgi:uncharacterized protein (DUF362 family)
MTDISRRDFLKYSSLVGGSMFLNIEPPLSAASVASPVAIVSTEDRKQGVQASVAALGINPVKGKNVLIKPNYNTDDPTPGSSHNDTVTALVDTLWQMGAKSITLGESSLRVTREVMESKGILPLMEKLNVRVLDFDTLEAKDWVLCKPKDSHWAEGFRIARPILESECLVYTCCIKTHRPLGVFTMSLKLGVGALPAPRNGFADRRVLHGSREAPNTNGRKMIAELNQVFKPSLIVMDGIDCFVDGGPGQGTLAKGNVFVASTDRIANDAVGVAVLKHLGSNDAIMKTKIFAQEQIARAVELGLGASSPSQIKLLAADEKTKELRTKIEAILKQG